MDVLVKLYQLPEIEPALHRVKEQNITIRKPIGPEKSVVIEWIRAREGEGWASEAETAFLGANRTIYIAVDENETKADKRMVGFACYDATAKGFFGPTAVAEAYRKRGIGQALLLSCLFNMKLDGYGYAIIGSISKTAKEFYEKCLPGSVGIEDSAPGIYRGMLVKS
ncbi:MAG: GNAT family N-acetyltransferase [Eubacteriales bacterium]